jgi:transposase
MSTSTLPTAAPPVVEDGAMSSSSRPRADGPSRRRKFTAAQKLEYLGAYERACEQGQGGAYLRREGLYSSLVFEWRRLRDAGVLAGKDPGEAIGALSRDQAEIARLRRALEVSERRLATTETALQIMGKAHELLESISESSATDRPRRRR